MKCALFKRCFYKQNLIKMYRASLLFKHISSCFREALLPSPCSSCCRAPVFPTPSNYLHSFAVMLELISGIHCRFIYAGLYHVNHLRRILKSFLLNNFNNSNCFNNSNMTLHTTRSNVSPYHPIQHFPSDSGPLVERYPERQCATGL